MNTSWMWNDHEQVLAITLDTDDQSVRWWDVDGCAACGDSRLAQTFADFLKVGPRYGTPPADILQEIETALRTLHPSPTN